MAYASSDKQGSTTSSHAQEFDLKEASEQAPWVMGDMGDGWLVVEELKIDLSSSNLGYQRW